MNDMTPPPLPPPSFLLLETLDNGRNWSEVSIPGTSKLAAVFAHAEISSVEITDGHGDARSYRRVVR